MEIYLIRHTAPLIAKGLIYGQTDVTLADSFVQEKEEVLKQLPLEFDAVYSSPLSRCALLAAELSADYQTDPALQELNFGDWEGKTWDDVAGPECDGWMNDFVNLAPPNGESMLQMEERIMLFWKKLLLQPFKNVAIVTHGGVIRILLARYRSVALKDAFTIKIEMGEVAFISAVSSFSH